MSKRGRRRRKRGYLKRKIKGLEARIAHLETREQPPRETAPALILTDASPETDETSLPYPKGWAEDRLTGFQNSAFRNIVGTFATKKESVGLLQEINEAFYSIGENLINPKDTYAAMLLPRCHSAYLAGTRLAMSGQATDTFPSLRACLEFALYALHINSNSDLGNVWMARHDDDKTYKASRTQFAHVKVMETLSKREKALHPIIHKLYTRTIDFGGHPNERSVTSSMKLVRTENGFELPMIYLHGDSTALDHVLKTSAQVGLGSLRIFRLVFPERFAILGINERLDSLKDSGL